MKNLLLSISIFAMLCVAQFSFSQTTMTGSDTVVNTATVNLDVTLKGSASSVSFHVIVDELSGTTDGTALLQGSNDGTTYFDLNTDTFQLADVATPQGYGWYINGCNPYLYYRIKVTGVGTMSAIASGYAMLRPRN